MVEVINMLSHTGAIVCVTHGVCGAQGAQTLTTSVHLPSTDAAHPRTACVPMGKTHAYPLLLTPTMRKQQLLEALVLGVIYD